MRDTIRTRLLTALIVLFSPSIVPAQREVWVGPARPESPKTVTFKVIRFENPQVDQEKLANFPFQKLSGAKMVLELEGIRFVSSPIKIQDSQGSCTIADVPPGVYSLSLPPFKMKTEIWIPAKRASTVAFVMKIGSSGIIITPESTK